MEMKMFFNINIFIIINIYLFAMLSEDSIFYQTWPILPSTKKQKQKKQDRFAMGFS